MKAEAIGKKVLFALERAERIWDVKDETVLPMEVASGWAMALNMGAREHWAYF